MKKIVIGLIVVAVVVLLAAYACGRMKDSTESAGNGAVSNEMRFRLRQRNRKKRLRKPRRKLNPSQLLKMR